MFNLGLKGSIKNKTIHNHSYIVLQKELDEKINIIKELNKKNKELKNENNSLKYTIETIKHQNMVDIINRGFYKNNLLPR